MPPSGIINAKNMFTLHVDRIFGEETHVFLGPKLPCRTLRGMDGPRSALQMARSTRYGLGSRQRG